MYSEIEYFSVFYEKLGNLLWRVSRYNLVRIPKIKEKILKLKEISYVVK